ncbi:MAG TPA: hypothetical protein VES88_12505 [Gemmatimonadaceae bacterium]|nr:hypothetical protein [Gemmatimonadaceae bacterium]
MSFEDPSVITEQLLDQIDLRWAERIAKGEPYRHIILIGHSVGAVLARSVYVHACGENADAPWGAKARSRAPKSWAKSVSRLILLAAMSRGWSISHNLSRAHAFTFWVATVGWNLLQPFTRRRPLIFAFRRGAPFVTQLRIECLSMARHADAKGVGGAVTVQLLGTVDDLVSPRDNIDLVSGRDFVYLDAPMSGHVNIRDMDSTEAGQRRAEVFLHSLLAEPDLLKSESVPPEDLLPYPPNDKVTDVIFVIHGIRDEGYWTQRIARRVKVEGRKAGRVFEAETSSYGYFPMLPFLLPSTRRAKVEWLMDEYTEDLALYPNAAFSFVGHSNGTYLLARALQDYPACHFQRVVFAGSVVSTRYDWSHMLERERVKAVLNYVATSDWVVAFFPKGFQQLRLQDLGSAGHDGFRESSQVGLSQIRFVHGNHSTAVQEANWDAIARFVVHGEVQKPESPLYGKTRSSWVVLGGLAPPVIWLIIVLIAAGAGLLLVWALWGQPEWLRTVALIVYLAALFRVLTRL